MIDTIAVYVNIFLAVVNSVIAGLTFWLLFIVSAEKRSFSKGIYNLSGSLQFIPEGCYGNETEGFEIFVINKEVTTQEVTNIMDDAGRYIYHFSNPVIKPGMKHRGFLEEYPDIMEGPHEVVDILKKAKKLFLVNRFGKKKRIASKKDIQEALKDYKKYSVNKAT